MRDPRMSAIGKGLKRRGRLMAEAVRPPRRTLDGVLSPRSPEGPDGRPYVAPPAPRLVDSPVFVLSSVRSGSTLLRVLLNSHSQIRAPHEMHLRTVHVHLVFGQGARSFRTGANARSRVAGQGWPNRLQGVLVSCPT
ncbi:sulfotransferase [Streptomyces sp. RLB1-33]|nr:MULTISPECIES: sulfotransferase [Streptomyces]